jgi:hypothetical protein
VENRAESKAMAAKTFGVNKTLTASSRRDTGMKSIGEHNTLLEDLEEKAIHDFIRLLQTHGMQPINNIVFSAIVSWKRAHKYLSISSRKTDGLGFISRRIKCLFRIKSRSLYWSV